MNRGRPSIHQDAMTDAYFVRYVPTVLTVLAAAFVGLASSRRRRRRWMER